MAKVKKEKLYKTCRYCEHMSNGKRMVEGWVCFKEFITDRDTDARECKYFSLGHTFGCPSSRRVEYLVVCLCKQDSTSNGCSKKCRHGVLARELYTETYGVDGKLVDHKCKNKHCEITIPPYKNYCSLQCWSDRNISDDQYYQKMQEKLAAERRRKTLRRISVDQVMPVRKLRRIFIANEMEPEVFKQRIRRVVYEE